MYARAAIHHIGKMVYRQKSKGEGFLDQVQPLNPDIFRKYVAFSRQHCHPNMTAEAGKILVESYVNTRTNTRTDSVPITVRNLLSMVRLSYACARMRLSDLVEACDAEKAVSLMMSTLSKVGIDQETGELDSLVIEAGNSKTAFDRTKLIKDIVKSLSSVTGKALVASVKEEAAKHGLSAERVDDILDRLRSNGDLCYPDWNCVKLV